jgi:membrane protein implicated in regulation of membrane protease activity
MMTTTSAWILLAIVAAILEIVSPLFGFLFVTGAAFVAAGTAILGLSLTVQLVLFVIVLLLSLVLLRPRLLVILGTQSVPSRTESLIGKIGLVTEAIDPILGSGRVTVGGEDWAARSLTPLPVGTRVHVTGADGIILEVTP